MVVLELIAPERWDMTADTKAAIIRPTKPEGSRCSTRFTKRRSGFSRFGNNFGATRAGAMIRIGIRNFEYWANIAPIRACHSFLAASVR